MTTTALEAHARRNTIKRTFGFRRDIQGLRAVAVLGVVLSHAGALWLPGGYVGVDVFFVISGFLITGLLHKEIVATGSIALRAFYARRIRRLLPASAVVLLATVAWSKIFLPPLLLPDIAQDALATSAFLSNMWFAYSGTDYLAGTAPSLFQHYWSLALEEQFYLVWPLLMVAIASASCQTSKGLRVSLTCLSAVSLVACIVLTSVDQPWAFFGLPTRAWELGAGGLLAISAGAISKWPYRLRRLLSWSGLATVLGTMVFFSEDLIFPGWAAVVPVVGALAIIAGGCGMDAPFRPLSSPVAQYFGKISYSLYLWHWPLLTMPALIWGTTEVWWIAPACVLTAVVLAHLTHKYVEMKFQHLPVLTSKLRWSYALGAGLTTVAILASFGLGRLPVLDAGREVPAPSAKEITQAPPVASFVPSNVSPRIVDSGDSLPDVYRDGCHADFRDSASPSCTYGNAAAAQTMVLFGDSHAAQWFSPLRRIAEQSGTRLVSLTKASCPSVSITVGNRYNRDYPECAEWRADAIQRINEIRPSVILMTNYSSVYRTLGHAGEDGYAEAWAAGLATTLQQLPQETRTLILGDTPSWPDSPNICLSANLNQADTCALPASDLIDDEALEIERQVVEREGGKFVASSEWFCAEKCSPVAWNVLVYRDESHVTDEMAALLATRLSDAINAGS